MLHGPMHYLVYVFFNPELRSYFYVQLSGSGAVIGVHTVFICLVTKGGILEGAKKHRKLIWHHPGQDVLHLLSGISSELLLNGWGKIFIKPVFS